MYAMYKLDTISFRKICEDSHRSLYSALYFAADPGASMKIQKLGHPSTWQYRTSFRIGENHCRLSDLNKPTKKTKDTSEKTLFTQMINTIEILLIKIFLSFVMFKISHW